MELKRIPALIAFIISLFAYASCEVYFTKGAPHVKLAHDGMLSGKVLLSRDGRPYTTFLGIPFATFNKRFEEAKLITKPTWEGVKSSAEPGPDCAQMTWFKGPRFGETECLHLNVYVPLSMEKPGPKGYPVIVSIHGGGFSIGDGYSASNPKYFMDEDVIVVTPNYRLGVFGFLSTEDEVVPGNNGMKDIVLALQWVQQHIKEFGGDPEKVTIIGLSAGGSAVHHLTLSTKASGLFQRAIAQSGSAFAQWGYRGTPRETAVELATYMKCTTTAKSPSGITSEEILTCLRDASAEELNNAQLSFKESFPNSFIAFLFSPSTEPESTQSPFHTKSPYELVTDLNSPLPQVPLIIGVTEEEGLTMGAGMTLANETLLNQLDSNWDELAPEALDFAKFVPSKEERLVVSNKLRDFYFGSKPITKEVGEKLVNVYSDELLTYSVWKSATETAKRGRKHPVYLYQFGYSVADADGNKKKTGHGDCKDYIYDFSEMIPSDESFLKAGSPDEKFSKDFVKLWASFAIHGEPNHFWGDSSETAWKPISKEEAEGKVPLKWYRIDENLRYVENLYEDRMKFWDQLFKDHFSQSLLSSRKKQKIEL